LFSSIADWSDVELKHTI